VKGRSLVMARPLRQWPIPLSASYVTAKRTIIAGKIPPPGLRLGGSRGRAIPPCEIGIIICIKPRNDHNMNNSAAMIIRY
jgi:hypothetical protein